MDLISASDVSGLLSTSNSASSSCGSGSDTGLRDSASGASFLLPLSYSAVKL